MSTKQRLLVGCMAALLWAGLPLHAQDADSVPNPVKAGKIGDSAYYNFEISTPSRADVGSMRFTLKERSGDAYVVEEMLRQGDAGETVKTVTYPLKPTLRAQVEAVYGALFTDMVIQKSAVTAGIKHSIDGKDFDCERVHFEFEATNQATKVKGDLYFDVHKDAGPMGFVMFRSIISYETAPGRFSLTQTLTIRMATEPKPANK